jgi:hypothetical protein
VIRIIYMHIMVCVGNVPTNCGTNSAHLQSLYRFLQDFTESPKHRQRLPYDDDDDGRLHNALSSPQPSLYGIF